MNKKPFKDMTPLELIEWQIKLIENYEKENTESEEE
jgi:hypothetical protein